MRDKNGLMIYLFEIITLIILYYVIGIKNLFLYAISYSLYKIFLAAFNHIEITKSLSKVKNKRKLFSNVLITLLAIALMFLLISVLVSDIINIVLNINDILLIFIFMGLSIITEPFIRLFAEYLISTTDNRKFRRIVSLYYAFDYFLVIVIAIITFRAFKLPSNISISMLYLSKILSMLLVLCLMLLINGGKNKKLAIFKDNINYRKEIKYILVNNSYKSLIVIVKNSFYYVSIIILYLILYTRYNYKIDTIWKDITFIYLYAIGIVNLIIEIVKEMNKELPKELSLTSRIYNNFKMMLSLAIVFTIISPLVCKLLFNAPGYALYLGMVNFLAIFSLLYDITYDFVRSKKIIHISLILSILVKIITIVPLINAFYRMGYNLIYGDILSSIIGMLTGIIVNYIYIRNIEKERVNYFTKLLDIFYDNIILCIILIVIQFIIPIETDSYFKSVGLLIIYLGISMIIMKLKSMKRG